MKLTLDRKYKLPTYTIGKLYIDGVYFCDTLEDIDRGLTQNMPLEEIYSKKIKNETAIPRGTYKVTMDFISPKYSQLKWYYINCMQGRMPRLLDVPGYVGVLIHPGNTKKDSSGCILIGQNKVKGQVINSKETFLKLYDILCTANHKEKIYIEIR